MFNLKNFRTAFFVVASFFFAAFLSSCNSTGWHQIDTKTSPPAVTAAAVAYNSKSQKAILFGGSEVVLQNNVSVLGWSDETWQWDGTNWEKLSPADHPSAREKFVMTYDESRDRIVLFGGATATSVFDDTWEWDGTNWQLMNPAHKPPARCCSAMAYDSSSKKVILYGGWDSQQNTFMSDVWLWDGKDWTQMPSNAPLMSGHSLVDFPPKSEVISIQTSSGGTWAWDGKKFNDLEIDSPPSRTDVRAAYDNQNGRIILFGGIKDKTFLNDTWIFDGTSWFELQLPVAPSLRFGHVMFYDTKVHGIVLFGGFQSDNKFLNDTWELQLPKDLSSFKTVLTPIPHP